MSGLQPHYESWFYAGAASSAAFSFQNIGIPGLHCHWSFPAQVGYLGQGGQVNCFV